MAPVLFITDRYPSEYASGVYINDRIWAQMSVPIDSTTATYYNFTVNTKDTYEPVDGTITVQGVSGEPNNAIIIFTPTVAFNRNTEYSVLASTGIKALNSPDYLADDEVWYFATGNTAASGLIGSENIIIPSGYTDYWDVQGSYGPVASGTPFDVVEVCPEKYAFDVPRNIPFIAIRFNAPIPSGINMADHIRIHARRVLGNVPKTSSDLTSINNIGGF